MIQEHTQDILRVRLVTFAVELVSMPCEVDIKLSKYQLVLFSLVERYRGDEEVFPLVRSHEVQPSI